MSSSAYDSVPYVGQAHRITHISHLFVTATVLGAAPPPPRTARVLELGCARGDNLVAMASSMPDAHFIGIDYSPVQIEQGQEMIRALGLTNVELTCQSVVDFDGAGGPFDYIIAHGLFSWVPTELQRPILDLIARHLTPSGIGYVSYNTLPGWNARTTVRDLMRFHAAGIDDPTEKVHAARGALEFVRSIATNPILLSILDGIIEESKSQEDWYIFHDWLEHDNNAFYLVDFVAMCAEAGLDYLGDASIAMMLTSNFGEKAREALASSDNQIRTEQYLDFLANRTFRQTLVRRQGMPQSSKPDLAALVRTSFLQSKLTSHSVEDGLHSFGFYNGTIAVQTNDPALVAVMSVLTDSARYLMPFDRLVELTVSQYGIPAETARTVLTDHAMRLFLSNALWISDQPSPCVQSPSARPVALPLARYQAKTANAVTNANIERMQLTPPLHALLLLLDGTRGPRQLLEAVRKGPQAAAFPSAEIIDESLKLLGHLALLQR